MSKLLRTVPLDRLTFRITCSVCNTAIECSPYGFEALLVSAAGPCPYCKAWKDYADGQSTPGPRSIARWQVSAPVFRELSVRIRDLAKVSALRIEWVVPGGSFPAFGASDLGRPPNFFALTEAARTVPVFRLDTLRISCPQCSWFVEGTAFALAGLAGLKAKCPICGKGEDKSLSGVLRQLQSQLDALRKVADEGNAPEACKIEWVLPGDFRAVIPGE
jgi:hypothetical protein